MTADDELPWWDKRLAYEGDSKSTAAYRRLQSWWRECRRGLPPGRYRDRNGRDRPLGSLLPAHATLADQLLSDEALAYARERVPAALAEGEKIERGRFERNLLGSQPMCFSLFGHLRAHPSAFARTLSAVLPLTVHGVDDVVCEHAPPAARRRLGDATSFDAFLRLSTSRGPLVVGVETKYTEPFSTPEYLKDSYNEVVDSSHTWFVPGVVDLLAGSATNQVWRQTMLLQEAAHAEGSDGIALVVARGADRAARAAVDGVQAGLFEPQRHLQLLTLEDLADAASAETGLAEWAERFRERYLEVASVP